MQKDVRGTPWITDASMKNECKLYSTIVLITQTVSSLQVHNSFHKNSRFELHSTVIVASLHERDFSALIVPQEWKRRSVSYFYNSTQVRDLCRVFVFIESNTNMVIHGGHISRKLCILMPWF